MEKIFPVLTTATIFLFVIPTISQGQQESILTHPS